MTVFSPVKQCSARHILCATLLIALLASSIAIATNSDDVLDPLEEETQHVYGDSVSVFMCADSGEYSGTHELSFLHTAMESSEAIDIPNCRSAFLGYIVHADGHQVRSLTVTTGIGFISSALCTDEVLKLQRMRSLTYKSIVYIGTSGFSPFIGGWDPTDTPYYKTQQKMDERNRINVRGEEDLLREVEEEEEPELVLTPKEFRAKLQAGNLAAKSTAASSPPVSSPVNFELLKSGKQLDTDGCSPLSPQKAIGVGSVCVTSGALLLTSGDCVEEVSDSQCRRFNCKRLLAGNHFLMDDTLARDIEAASANKQFPAMPPGVTASAKKWWAANEAVETEPETLPQPRFVPCVEATINNLYSGAELDYLCREHTAAVLNEKSGAAAHTARDVVCVQAMESFGFLQSMQAAPHIPIAVIRGASNYDMYPQQKLFLTANRTRGGISVSLGSETTAALERHAELFATGDPSVEEDAAVGAYVWRQNTAYTSAEEHETFVISSFHYSIRTVTFVLSNYFFGGRRFDAME